MTVPAVLVPDRSWHWPLRGPSVPCVSWAGLRGSETVSSPGGQSTTCSVSWLHPLTSGRQLQGRAHILGKGTSLKECGPRPAAACHEEGQPLPSSGTFRPWGMELRLAFGIWPSFHRKRVMRRCGHGPHPRGRVPRQALGASLERAPGTAKVFSLLLLSIKHCKCWQICRRSGSSFLGRDRRAALRVFWSHGPAEGAGSVDAFKSRAVPGWEV